VGVWAETNPCPQPKISKMYKENRASIQKKGKLEKRVVWGVHCFWVSAKSPPQKQNRFYFLGRAFRKGWISSPSL
jgi:hypothetical protein